MLDSRGLRPETYLNPVYSKSFPDPFVLKVRGEYFAYCTGFAPDGNVFAVLRSSDLVTWTEIGWAMKPLDNSPPYYWGPEVSCHNGKFYLYYSVGNETLMQIRVAVSDEPGGGFIDSGIRLTSEDFAIDPHVFIDDDGSRYLFYATDFLEHTHIGTGTVVDRMLDWFTLDGNPTPVTRAKYDWQIYDPNRKEKGGVRWHTVEGPAVLKRKGVYYEMFSGGNWQNTTYGVSFAVSDSVQGFSEWRQFSDGDNVLPILRTIPGIVVGPGHNCVVRGPNNREVYCVYHRWVEDQRVMAIDRMDFTGTRIFVVGATHAPQPAPFEARLSERFRDSQLAPDLLANGAWQFTSNGAVSDATGRCEIKLQNVPESFLMELTWRLAEPLNADGSFGVLVKTSDGFVLLDLSSKRNAGAFTVGETTQGFDLPEDFLWTALHILRVDVDYRRVRIRIDEGPVDLNGVLAGPVKKVTMFSDRQGSMLSSLQLTEGFEELFESGDPLTENGWTIDTAAECVVENRELIVRSEDECLIRKGPALATLEFAANFRTLDSARQQGGFGLVLLDEDRVTLRLAVDCERLGVEVIGASSLVLPFPDGIELSQYHQLRIVKSRSRTICYFDDVTIGEFSLPETNTAAAVFCRGTRIALEMIRLTSI